MKKIAYLVLIFAVMMASCEKMDKHSINDQKIVMSQEMTETEGSIIGFLELMDSESEDLISLDQAEYFLEAGFNYRYAHIGNDNDLTITRVDTSIVSLSHYEGYCSYDDLKSSFNMIYEAMDGVFDAIIDDHKALSIVQISLTDENDLQVISLWKYSQFTFGGDWRWGLKAGKCDGTYQGRDATNAIAWFYNVNFANPQPYGIWTNVAFSNWYHGGASLLDEPNNPFGYGNSLLFYAEQWSGQPIHCMLQTENYFYASLLPEAIDRIANSENITKSVIKILLDHDQINSGNPHPIMHRVKVVFGDYSPTNHAPEDDFYLE
jgi:hypothetical protein